ncbi:flagellar biosynthetic protein FliR [Acetobacter fallax]|uniref:Type III secretion protein n=1 Tax=Acetobacter fallax TaxID=1737473 RepID=A0ABX0K613_9PROT|nr:flagellar biosynthetic protein FliR [Acetobacter fallax]NHO31824.1 type III secretion protein [Acetobacter fallax]NHO35413.1 type III secretion protein [Acetobacter fallax]
MSGDLTVFIAALPTQMVVFVAILCRVVAMVVTLPGLSTQTVPSTIKAGLAISIAFLMFPVLKNHFLAAETGDILDPGRAIVLICSETLSGGLIGWLAQLMALSFPVSVQILSTFTGLSNVLQPDPDLGAQSTAVSHLASLSVPVVMFSTGLYVFPLYALAGSYQVFPPGHFPLMGDAAHSVTEMTQRSFLLAFQLAMPFVLLGTVWPAMLGLLSRFSPGLQVYSLAMPAQLLGGIFLLALLIRGMVATWTQHLDAALASLPGIGGL